MDQLWVSDVTKHRQTIGTLLLSAAAMSISIQYQSRNLKHLHIFPRIRSLSQSRTLLWSLSRQASSRRDVLRKWKPAVTRINLPGGTGHLGTVNRRPAGSPTGHSAFLTWWNLSRRVSFVGETSTQRFTINPSTVNSKVTTIQAEQSGVRTRNDLRNTTRPVSKNSEVKNA